MKPVLFERRHGPGSYEKMVGLLNQECNTFADVGRRFGLTRARVHQIYSELFPPRPRFDRRRSCSISHSKPVRPFGEAVLKAWRKARKLGFSVGKVSKPYRLTENYWNRLRIENKLCVVYNPQRKFACRKGRPGTYYITFTPKVPADFHILVTERSDYVFPAEVLKCLGKTIYVPVHNLPIYKNIRPRTDWKKFREAWHLLEGDKPR